MRHLLMFLATITLFCVMISFACAQPPAQTKEPPLANPPATPHGSQPACHGGERTFYTPVRNGIAFIRDHKPLRTAAGNIAHGVACRIRCCARCR